MRITRSWSDTIRRAIGDGDDAAALELLGTSLVVSPANALRELRWHGLLRLSSYGFETAHVTSVHGGLVSGARAASFSDEICEYLESVARLYSVGDEVVKLRRQIGKALRFAGPAIFDGLARTVDLLFLRKAFRPNDESSRSRILSNEALAEALSDIWVLATQLGLEPRVGWIPVPHIEAILDSSYLDLLRVAMPIRKYVEWERLIDVFSFVFSEDRPRRRYRIRASNPDTEKAIRWGFIQAEQQGLLRSYRAEVAEDAASYADVVKLLEVPLRNRYNRGILQRVDDVYPRYRLELPIIPELLSQLATRQLFAEEIRVFATLSEEYSLHPEEIQAVDIGNDLTLWDVMVFQRIVRIMQAAFEPTFKELLDKEPEIVVTSLLPTMRRTRLLTFLEPVVGRPKAEALLDLLTWKPSQKYFDLQYQPILAWRDFDSLPTAVVASSNVVRNTLQFRSVRIGYPKGDPGDDALARAIQHAGGMAAARVKYSVGGQTFETDVVGKIDDLLVAFEVKRTLLPTNPKELQTTLQLVDEAVDQLERFAAHWRSPVGRAAITKAVGWSLADVNDIATGIILPNRMFSGMRRGGHAIRGLHETANFIETGTTEFGELEGETISTLHWKGTKLGAPDMLAYLREDVLHRKVFDSMQRTDQTVRIGRVSVVEETYALNIARFIERLKRDGH